MAKAPVRDRFRITCETEAENMGPLIAQLTRMGMTNLSYELVSETHAYRNNSKAPPGEAMDLVRAWVQEHPTFKAIEAVKHFEAQGRTRNATYAAVLGLVQSGELKQLGAGNYARADVKHIEDGAKRTRKSAPPKKFDKRGEDVIVSWAKRNHGRVNTAKLKEIFLAEGRAVNSVYASCDALLKGKLIKRTGEGTYELTAKGRAHKPEQPHRGSAKKAKKKAALNGGAPRAADPATLFEAPATEAAHG